MAEDRPDSPVRTADDRPRDPDSRAAEDRPRDPDSRAAEDRLDDPDYPAYTTGRAAEALGVQQAFLRALDTAGVVTPVRSAGGHRRYTRRQLTSARRIRDLFDQGHNLASTQVILALQDDLAAERALVARLREAAQDPQPED